MPSGQPVAVTSWNGRWVVQTRESDETHGPALVLVSSGGSVGTRIELAKADHYDTGHMLFHHAASDKTHLACVSCHAEGHDDGHVWVFDTLGKRRSPTVAGGVLETAPLHWSGDMRDLGDIMQEVFVNRMGGTPQGPRAQGALGDWLETIPAYPASPTGTQAQIDHGKQIFERADVGCTMCHKGKHMTDNLNHDVGTGGSFQTPTLIGVAARAPFMHDGCAAALQDRFDPAQSACNGGQKHGQWDQLSTTDVADLISYLETL
jgi:cytochrome c peroxidase